MGVEAFRAEAHYILFFYSFINFFYIMLLLATLIEVHKMETFTVKGFDGKERTVKKKEMIFEGPGNKFIAAAYEELAEDLDGKEINVNVLAQVDICLSMTARKDKDSDRTYYNNNVRINAITLYG